MDVGGYECVEGFASCTTFINDWVCDTHNGDGCDRVCDNDWSMEACENIVNPTGGNCQFTCHPPDYDQVKRFMFFITANKKDAGTKEKNKYM